MPSGSNGRNTSALTNSREQTREALQRSFKVHITDTAKTAARKVGQSAETVDVYRQVNVPIAWAQMVEWCRAYPAFALDVMEHMGLDIDQDRNAYVLFLQLQKQVRGE